MRKAALPLALIALALVPCATALAQTDDTDSLEADVRRMMETSGAAATTTQIMTQVVSQFRESLPQVPAEFWDRFLERVDGSDVVEMMVPIYARHFTRAEIQDILAFYETPTGQKLIATMPTVMQEVLATSQQWGRDLAEQLMEELKAKGYTPDA